MNDKQRVWMLIFVFSFSIFGCMFVVHYIMKQPIQNVEYFFGMFMVYLFLTSIYTFKKAFWK